MSCLFSLKHFLYQGMKTIEKRYASLIILFLITKGMFSPIFVANRPLYSIFNDYFLNKLLSIFVTENNICLHCCSHKINHVWNHIVLNIFCKPYKYFDQLSKQWHKYFILFHWTTWQNHLMWCLYNLSRFSQENSNKNFTKGIET